MYGNQVATILTSHKTQGESEALILQDALRYNKPEKLEELKPIAEAYTQMVQDILETSVPSSYAQKHLDLANALNAVREDVNGMMKVNDDALYTFVRMKRYQDDVLGLSNAILNIFNTLYFTDNVRFNSGDATLKLMTFTP
jgi:outer membrane receptor for Fe3+-dicitrate